MRERLVVIDDQISPALVQELCGKKIETWKIEDGACVPDHSINAKIRVSQQRGKRS